MIIQTSDYVSPAVEPRFSPFWSLQLRNIQLVVLLRQPVVISLRGKTFCSTLTDQGGRESRCSAENLTEGKKKTTDWKDKVLISKGRLHPFHLIEIQVKGTGMYASWWTDHPITPDISESAIAISLLAVFLRYFSHRNQM